MVATRSVVVPRPTDNPCQTRPDACSKDDRHPGFCDTERLWYCDCLSFVPSARWDQECAGCGRSEDKRVNTT
jgi:hypothetical protein